MKKVILSAVFIGAFVLYIFMSRQESAYVVPSSVKNSFGSPPSDVGFPAGQASGNGSATAQSVVPAVPPSSVSSPIVQTPLVTGQYKDGAYMGTLANAYYGNVQVKATIQGGRLADVQFLSYPNDRTTSKRISEQAMPVLKSEAIQAQSAHVDVVSGATETSQAFMESLAAALSQAKI